ncbi:hypothetical protein C8R47DRAFT_446167 [Mycena vitilis]|nr:hypothetical protein C8R47DRAFT_446167 [Mycena vitilis]
MPSSHWSKIPPEIVHEIARYNANDTSCLHSMSLVSKAMRFSAIEHLFSGIRFACAEDFHWWLEMVRRTPILTTIVKRVKFSQRGAWWLKENRSMVVQTHRSIRDVSQNQPSTHTELLLATIPPLIPSLPNVSVVEWEYFYDLLGKSDLVAPCVSMGPTYLGLDLTMVVAYMALLPNVQTLCLKDMSFNGLLSFTNFVVVCGNLKALSVVKTIVDVEYIESEHESDSDSPSDVGISAGLRRDRLQLGPIKAELQDLAVTECAYTIGEKYLIHLAENSSPSLKSLSFGRLGHEQYDPFEDPCSLLAMEKLLSFGAPTINNLTIEPTFSAKSENTTGIVRMMGSLPSFPALEVLTIWLRANDQAAKVLNAFTAAPNLTKLIFRVFLYEEHDDENRQEFNKILRKVFPWGGAGSESMKTVLTRKFPSLQKIGFHFCAPRDSNMQFRRGFRWSRAEQLKWRLKKTGADVEEYLEVEWLDVEDDYRPVVYNKANGKPPWTVVRREWERDPPTEASDQWEPDR